MSRALLIVFLFGFSECHTLSDPIVDAPDAPASADFSNQEVIALTACCEQGEARVEVKFGEEPVHAAESDGACEGASVEGHSKRVEITLSGALAGRCADGESCLSVESYCAVVEDESSPYYDADLTDHYGSFRSIHQIVPDDIDADGDGYWRYDCDDTNAAINPLAMDLQNGVDDDCDGEGDETLESLTAGNRHTCGIDGDGELHCWGYNHHGQTDVPEIDGRWAIVEAGGDSTCAIDQTGALYCWGHNGNGQNNAPAIDGHWTAVSAGGTHTCGVDDQGALYCWGDDYFGQLDTPEIGRAWVSVSVGTLHACGIDDASGLHCWGYGLGGQTDVPSVWPGWHSVSSGGIHSCGVDLSGGLHCWGATAAADVPAVGGYWSWVAAGRDHTCALDTAVGVRCWGSVTVDPLASPESDGGWKAAAVGQHHACGLSGLGELTCWGSNLVGQLNWYSDAPADQY